MYNLIENKRYILRQCHRIYIKQKKIMFENDISWNYSKKWVSWGMIFVDSGVQMMHRYPIG